MQRLKNSLIYCAISLAVVGGIYVGSAKNTEAATISAQITYGGQSDVQHAILGNVGYGFSQKMPPDISGNFGSYTIRGNFGLTGTPSNEIILRIRECINSDYTDCTVVRNYSGDTVHTGTRHGFYNIPVSSTEDFYTITIDPVYNDQAPFTFNASKFYIMEVDVENTSPIADDWYVNGGASALLCSLPNQNTFTDCGGLGAIFYDLEDTPTFTPPVTDTSTHFISLYPENGTTTATTSAVGASIYANGKDFDAATGGRLHIHFTQDSAFACQNSGAVYDAVYTCAGSNTPASPFDVDFGTTSLTALLAGSYNYSENIIFPAGGKWTGTYEIQQASKPWYYAGLFTTYNTLVSTTTHITIGQLSPMDMIRAAVASSSAAFASTTQHGIGAILASTTASLATACNPFTFSSNFNLGDCLTLVIWPGQQAISDDFTIIQNTPPWGYVFRVIDLLSATTSSSSMPQIDYTFATDSPMSVMGDIHFDPFGEIASAGTLVNEMTSDRSDHATVWTILMPIVNIFVYLVLAFMIIHDLTGIHSHAGNSKPRRDEITANK